MRKKRVSIDFDGVIADYSQGYQGVGVYGDPLPGCVEALCRLHADDWYIIIYTARQEVEIPYILRYLDEHGIPYDEVVAGKPSAHAYVDDRAIRFDGDWSQSLQDILEFEPYHYRDALWIHVDTKLPALYEEVWIYDRKEGIVIGALALSGWHDFLHDDRLYQVTHWMPMDKPDVPCDGMNSQEVENG